LTLQIASNLFLAIGGSYDWLFWGRLTQGIAAGLLWLSAYAITADLAAKRRAGNMFGAVEEMLARGGLYGAIIGAPVLLITNFAQWAWTIMFLIYAALCAAGLWIAWQHVPETWQKPQQAPATLTPAIQRTKIQQFIHAVPKQLWLLATIVVSPLRQVRVGTGADQFLLKTVTENAALIALAYLPRR
jgi:MFS family permease